MSKSVSNAQTARPKVVRYAVVGTGGRVPMFLDPMLGRFRADCELVGICDVNPARMEYYNHTFETTQNYHRVPAYLAGDFDKMVRETRPDVVIVTTVDAFHHQYIIRAMELGCNVVTEKPMTTDDQKCRAILDAVRKTGRKVRVIFNNRWGPGPSQVRKLLAEGAIGQIVHVGMEYLLNTSHGADYFRRWHREKDKSGGLMVHKSTHHFDLINWWIDAVPDTVFGIGKLAFYGRKNAEARGVEVKYDRYTGHDTASDPFAFRLDDNELQRELYLRPEKHDGYQRDRNVFGDNITIEDSMSVLVQYRTGAVLNYSLNAYLPREGYYVVFNGTKGRLEYTEDHGAHVITGDADEEHAILKRKDYKCVLHPMFGKPVEIPFTRGVGGHGGGDMPLQEQIFSAHPPADPLGRSAGHEQGAASILIGVAANQCFKTGVQVKIKDLCPQLGDARQLHELV